MIRRHMFMSALVATVALSGCGGGKGSSATPTPTGTPTPTPTASPTYAAFPLAGPAEFNTYNAAISYTGDPSSGAVTLGAASTEALIPTPAARVRLATDTAVATGTYVMRENTEESRFCVPTGQTCTSTLVTPSAVGNPEFIFRTNDATTAGKFAQVEFLNNVVKDTSTNTAALALSRVSYANWWRGDSTTGQKRLTYTAWGYPTTYADMPTTGTVSYGTLTVTGRLVSVVGATTTVNQDTGAVLMSTNFATGAVTMTLTLSTIPAGGGAAVTYGTFTAQGAIPVGQNQWTGSFVTGSPLSGTLAGGFFGSQGEQAGVVFSATGTFGGAQQSLIGVVVGKK